jgi:hypothetical protein
MTQFLRNCGMMFIPTFMKIPHLSQKLLLVEGEKHIKAHGDDRRVFPDRVAKMG